jgi:hypothetical protein
MRPVRERASSPPVLAPQIAEARLRRLCAYWSERKADRHSPVARDIDPLDLPHVVASIRPRISADRKPSPAPRALRQALRRVPTPGSWPGGRRVRVQPSCNACKTVLGTRSVFARIPRESESGAERGVPPNTGGAQVFFGAAAFFIDFFAIGMACLPARQSFCACESQA